MDKSNSVTTRLFRVRQWLYDHKIWAVIIFTAVAGASWVAYARATSTTGQVRYILGTVSSTTIIASISGSGQVSPLNQVDIKPRASGEITSVVVKQGDVVRAGQALAYIDAQDAQKTVRDAQANLESAQISLQKLQAPPTALTLTQAQNALTNAEDALTKLYSDSQTDIVNAFLDLPSTLIGLQDILTGTDTNSSSQWNADYYLNAIETYDARARAFYDTANTDFAAAKKSYDATFSDYHALSNSPEKPQVEKLLKETYDTTTLTAKALKSVRSYIQFYVDTLELHNATPVSAANTALADLDAFTSKINTHLSSLLSDTTSLKSDKQSVLEKQQSLEEVRSGSDALDLKSAQLNVTKAQNALLDAQNALADYTIRAPFSGTIANVEAKKGDSASSGTTAATIITSDQIADLLLNEVDVAKVEVGQKATLTFDAIDELSIAGTVAAVDTLGTVSQGVVSYEVKIEFSTQDTRVKPGMTVNASIITDSVPEALAVPASAVKSQNGESFVQVFRPAIPDTGGTTGVLSTQTPQNVPVTTGISDDTNVQIISGLLLGDQVIVRSTTSGNASTATRANTSAGTRSGQSGGNVFRAL